MSALVKERATATQMMVGSRKRDGVADGSKVGNRVGDKVGDKEGTRLRGNVSTLVGSFVGIREHE
jgi:hypothetical protein